MIKWFEIAKVFHFDELAKVDIKKQEWHLGWNSFSQKRVVCIAL